MLWRERKPARTTMIVPVWISVAEDPDRELLTYALLDTMSCITFVSESLSKELKAHTHSTSLRLNTMTARNRAVKCDRVSGLRIRSMNDEKKHELPAVYTTDQLEVNPENIPTSDTAREIPHLQHIAQHMLSPQAGSFAGLLIGYDNPDLLMPLEVVQGKPYAIRTPLGWSIVGDIPPKTLHTMSSTCLTARS